MPLVGAEPGAGLARAAALFPRCGNPRCPTGWIRLWRSRRVPGFEGRWACSAECMAELVGAAVRREMRDGDGAAAAYAHRIPLGLMLVESGCLSEEQLRAALEGQRGAAAAGEPLRLGEWLVRQGRVREEVVARVLAAQWGSPLLRLGGFRAERTCAALPHFLAEALRVLPAGVAEGRALYLAFSDGIDRSLSYAVERMTGLRVIAGVARDSEFKSAAIEYLKAASPRTRFLEAAGAGVFARAVTRLVESEKPAETRLVRVHNWYWLRLWKREPGPGLPAPGKVEDLLCSIGPIGNPEGA